ncbi:MAG: hypothetical protein NTX53_11895 [candidate division WOR-3 bacterium]|nr:hypothetical protein [candidate division WOR-3 bacterium]
MIQLRKLHLIIGFVLVPFLFIQAVTGFAQVLGMFPSLAVRLHSWHVIFRYLGLVVATGLAFLAVSGCILYLTMRIQQAKRRAKAKATPAKPA